MINISLSSQVNDLHCLDHMAKEINEYNLIIYAYSGDEKHEPIYYEEIDLFKKMLAKAGLNCHLVEVSDTAFSPSKWDPKHSLIYIPGAIASHLDTHIGSKVEEIREFVNRGGKFLGQCGGGYWACREVKYRVNDKFIHKVRNLAFWKGIEQGPLIPFVGKSKNKIEYLHDTVKIKWTGSDTLRKYLPDGLEFHVLLSGGGFFIPANEEHRYKSLATYVEKVGAFAIVKAYVGDGTAVLFSPYLTYGYEYLKSSQETYEINFPEHNWSKIVSDLEGTELKSLLCFADMLLETIDNDHT